MFSLSASSYQLPASSFRSGAALLILSGKLEAGSRKLVKYQPRFRIEIQRPWADISQPSKSRGADHRSVIGRQRERRNEDRESVSRATGLGVGAKPAVGRDAARDPDAPRAEPSCGLECAIE